QRYIIYCKVDSGTRCTLADVVSLCIDATSLTPGVDSSCIVICDNLGLCDTAYYVITVMDEIITGAPMAVDDIDSTFIDQAVVVNALGNDQVPPDYDVFEVISGPTNGTAIADPLGVITYTPDPGFCGATDSLEYRVCNAAGCDTALVTIFVSCEPPVIGGELEIFDGFSPNGDGVADEFTIRNIEGYPNHRLYIYNRWGNLVFQNESATERWDGTWDGKDVPDGVYFYVLDTGEGERMSGYIMLRR
ncbi:MAG: gliding motility-associated C-terminal domain-containing protein, partial [Bacteroidota bacterium]